MRLQKYYMRTTLLALIGSPIAMSIGLMGSLLLALIGLNEVALSFPPLLLLAAVWFYYAKNVQIPDSAVKAFLPLMAIFSYYMLVWILVNGLANYHFGHTLFSTVFIPATIPYLIFHWIFLFNGDVNLFPLLIAAATLIAAIAVMVACIKSKKRLIVGKGMIAHGLIFALLSSIAGFQYFDRNAKILTTDSREERVQEEVDLALYRPFATDNKLVRLTDKPTILIQDNYPKLDGATALYPVYGAMVQAVYRGLDNKTVGNYVQCTNTQKAYERLINGEVDIFFGAQPSKQQIERAKEKGVEFVLTPIAKEAFVFFVNKDNPVRSLTLKQIQDIYQKQQVNWSEVGGNNEKITPFQRPENSGSQTIMLAKVMQGKVLPPPQWEEYAGGMGDIISRVATYRNDSSAIGYSFRYYATTMKSSKNIKLLEIDGIEPNAGNIRNGSYPFTVDVYAVTIRQPEGNGKKMLDWILSEQGQRFIEMCGYVRR